MVLSRTKYNRLLFIRGNQDWLPNGHRHKNPANLFSHKLPVVWVQWLHGHCLQCVCESMDGRRHTIFPVLLVLQQRCFGSSSYIIHRLNIHGLAPKKCFILKAHKIPWPKRRFVNTYPNGYFGVILKLIRIIDSNFNFAEGIPTNSTHIEVTSVLGCFDIKLWQYVGVFFLSYGCSNLS